MKDRYPKCVKKVYTFLSAVTIDPGWWGNAWHRRAGTRGCAPGSRARKSGERWLLVEALHVSKWGKPEINNTVINWILELSLCSGGSVRSYVNYEILKVFCLYWIFIFFLIKCFLRTCLLPAIARGDSGAHLYTSVSAVQLNTTNTHTAVAQSVV